MYISIVIVWKSFKMTILTKRVTLFRPMIWTSSRVVNLVFMCYYDRWGLKWVDWLDWPRFMTFHWPQTRVISRPYSKTFRPEMPSFWSQTGGKNAFLYCYMTKDSYYTNYSFYGVIQWCAAFGLTEINLVLKRWRTNFI